MKTTIFLVNFGGPRSTEEIPVFLTRLMGRSVPPALTQALVERYQSIGGFSPLAHITEQQAALLKATLPDHEVKAVFRYTHPSIEEGINEARSSAVERLVFLIMTPFYNTRTVDSYVKAAQSYLALLAFKPETIFLHTWHLEPLFLQSWIQKLKEETGLEEALYLFSAHSLPVSQSEPYRTQIEESMKAIALACPLGAYDLGWQSIPPVTNEPWRGPSVEAVMDKAAGSFSKIIQVPLGYVSDHLETLYDIDQVHRAYALEKGFQYQRVTSLNTYPPFIAALSRLLDRSLQEH